MLQYWADLATEWKRQVTTAHANQTTGLTNGRAANWAPEVEFSLYRALPRCQMTFPFYIYIHQYILYIHQLGGNHVMDEDQLLFLLEGGSA